MNFCIDILQSGCDIDNQPFKVRKKKIGKLEYWFPSQEGEYAHSLYFCMY